MSGSKDIEHDVHSMLEEIAVKALPLELIVAAKATILCPTCPERDNCKHRSHIDDAWQSMKERLDGQGVEGIRVPEKMFDRGKES